jgi:hypothetical protein
MTTNFFHLSLLLLFLDPGSEIWDPRSGIRDPGSGMGKNQDPGSGINIPDPQHCLYSQRPPPPDEKQAVSKIFPLTQAK